jgi:hypothetical protein
MPVTATKVRKGAIERATAPATENITSGKLVLPNFERQSPLQMMARPADGRFCVLSKGRELAVLTTDVGDGVAW